MNAPAREAWTAAALVMTGAAGLACATTLRANDDARVQLRAALRRRLSRTTARSRQ